MKFCSELKRCRGCEVTADEKGRCIKDQEGDRAAQRYQVEQSMICSHLEVLKECDFRTFSWRFPAGGETEQLQPEEAEKFFCTGRARGTMLVISKRLRRADEGLFRVACPDVVSSLLAEA